MAPVLQMMFSKIINMPKTLFTTCQKLQVDQAFGKLKPLLYHL